MYLFVFSFCAARFVYLRVFSSVTWALRASVHSYVEFFLTHGEPHISIVFYDKLLKGSYGWCL